MYLVELEDEDDDLVWINVDHIITVRPHIQGPKKWLVQIDATENNTIVVKGSIEQVLRRIYGLSDDAELDERITCS